MTKYITQKGILFYSCLLILFRAGNTIFIMIDLRFYRTYHPGDKNTLIGRNQYRWVEKELIVFYYFMYIYSLEI